MNKNEDQDIVRRLKRIWAKDNLTMKDLLLVKLCVAAGERAAWDIEQNYDFAFEDLETLLGRGLENISLAEYINKQRATSGRPIGQKTADILYKLLLFVPPHLLKKHELEKTRNDYLSHVEVKDKRNPFFQKALTKANTAACMRIKRAYQEAYEEGLIGGTPHDFLVAETNKLLEGVSEVSKE